MEKGKIEFENESETHIDFLDDIGWAGGGKNQQVFIEQRNSITKLEEELKEAREIIEYLYLYLHLDVEGAWERARDFIAKYPEDLDEREVQL